MLIHYARPGAPFRSRFGVLPAKTPPALSMMRAEARFVSSQCSSTRESPMARARGSTPASSA